MNPKRIIIVSSMALAISIGGMLQSDQAKARASVLPANKPETSVAAKDDLHQALGVTSNEEIYDALYSGKSLADIAEANNKDVQGVIDLQTAQLSEQLDRRLAAGSLTLEQYKSHKSELREIVTDSVFNKKNSS